MELCCHQVSPCHHRLGSHLHSIESSTPPYCHIHETGNFAQNFWLTGSECHLHVFLSITYVVKSCLQISLLYKRISKLKLSISCVPIAFYALIYMSSPLSILTQACFSLMCAATQLDNTGNSIRNGSMKTATPFNYGGGQVNPNSAYDPGLIYNASSLEYTLFLCAVGYNGSEVTAARNPTLSTWLMYRTWLMQGTRF